MKYKTPVPDSVWMTEDSITKGLEALKWVKGVRSFKHTVLPHSVYPMGDVIIVLRVSLWTRLFRSKSVGRTLRLAVENHFPVNLGYDISL